MTTPEMINGALQVLRDACHGYGLAAATVRLDTRTVLTYAPGEGAVANGESGITASIPEGHVLKVTTTPGA